MEPSTARANGFDRRRTYCLGTRIVHKQVGRNCPQRRGPGWSTSKRPNCPRVHIETNTSKRTRENAREELEYERPTEKEVVEYFRDIGGSDVADQLGQEFHTHYESTGWMCQRDADGEVETQGAELAVTNEKQTKQ